jgi:hypothetical protein
MTPEIAEKYGVEPCVLVTLSGFKARLAPNGRVRVLADIGLRAAMSGVNAAEYLALIRRARADWAIVPDAFGDFRETLRLWHKHAPLIARHAAPILVLQGFHALRPVLHALDLGARRVALPMRRHPDVSCAEAPRLCAERAARALGVLCGAADHVHLLGPALKSLRLLLPRLRCPASPHPGVPLQLSAPSGHGPHAWGIILRPPRGWGTPRSQSPRAEPQHRDF